MNSKKLTLAEYFYKYGLYIVFLLLIVFFTFENPKFILPVNLRNILEQASALGIVSSGLVIVMITAGIDLSIGSTMYFVATLAVGLINKGLVPQNIFGMFITFVFCMIVGAIVGSVNGIFISIFNLPPIIVTLATYSIIRGLVLVTNHISNIYFTDNLGNMMGRGLLFGVIPTSVIIFAVVLLVGQYTLTYTKFGRQIYAIGNNPVASQKVGIKVVKLKFLVYAIAGAMAGVSGILLAAQVASVATTFASDTHFVAISCVVLGGVSLFGGRGKIFPGALIGVLIIVCIQNGLVFMSTDPYLYTVVRGIVIFLAVMLDCVMYKGETK
jgi:ribose/xylose/arabinose/galactoside ABC-type transport system permease subunit